MCDNNEKKKLDIEGLEGLRGDGERNGMWFILIRDMKTKLK